VEEDALKDALTLVTGSPDETIEIGRRLGAMLEPGDVIVFTGDLGAGKTTMIAGIVSGAGSSVRAKSPTFTIMVEYPARIPLYHFDAYRLSEDDLIDIGIGDYVTEGGACLIEWGRKIEHILPDERLDIDIRFGRTPEEREITLTPHGEGWQKRLVELEGSLVE
jgi:tRNA threonylcarbamoyladenosine biosynthesis protein TsaE